MGSLGGQEEDGRVRAGAHRSLAVQTPLGLPPGPGVGVGVGTQPIPGSHPVPSFPRREAAQAEAPSPLIAANWGQRAARNTRIPARPGRRRLRPRAAGDREPPPPPGSAGRGPRPGRGGGRGGRAGAGRARRSRAGLAVRAHSDSRPPGSSLAAAAASRRHRQPQPQLQPQQQPQQQQQQRFAARPCASRSPFPALCMETPPAAGC